MLTTLDAKPQEWMHGDENVIHTVAACTFENHEHAEHWINILVPRDSNGNLVKWSGGRRKEKTRQLFIDNCIKHRDEFDFKINCISSREGEMSWFAWAFYYENRSLISQRMDEKNRNCLVFSDLNGGELSFPVLRAGYLIWYHHVIRYLVEHEHIRGKFLSDNFCADEKGPGEGKALGVSFVNFLLSLSQEKPQVSLPSNPRVSNQDLISDCMCGWVNSVRTEDVPEIYKQKLQLLEGSDSKIVSNIEFMTNLNIIDEHGNDVTEEVKQMVANGS